MVSATVCWNVGQAKVYKLGHLYAFHRNKIITICRCCGLAKPSWSSLKYCTHFLNCCSHSIDS